MKPVRITAAKLNGQRLGPEDEIVVLKAEIAKIEVLPIGSTIPFGRDGVVLRETILAAYRNRLEQMEALAKNLNALGEKVESVFPEIEQASAAKSLSIGHISAEVKAPAEDSETVSGLVQVDEEGNPVADNPQAGLDALLSAIERANPEDGTLDKIKGLIEEMKLTQPEADHLCRKLAELAALNKYAKMPTEELAKQQDEARLRRLANRGFIVPGSGLAVPAPPQKRPESKLERKLRRGNR